MRAPWACFFFVAGSASSMSRRISFVKSSDLANFIANFDIFSACSLTNFRIYSRRASIVACAASIAGSELTSSRSPFGAHPTIAAANTIQHHQRISPSLYVSSAKRRFPWSTCIYKRREGDKFLREIGAPYRQSRYGLWSPYFARRSIRALAPAMCSGCALARIRLRGSAIALWAIRRAMPVVCISETKLRSETSANGAFFVVGELQESHRIFESFVHRHHESLDGIAHA